MAHARRAASSSRMVRQPPLHCETPLTDDLAQSPMDPALPDGVHDWRPGVKFRKEGYKVTIEGTDTLAGRSVPLMLDSFGA